MATFTKFTRMPLIPKKLTVYEYLLNLETWSRSSSQLYHLQLLSLQTVATTYTTPEIIKNLHSHLKLQRGLWKIKQVQEIPKLGNATILAFLTADNQENKKKKFKKKNKNKKFTFVS